MESELKPEAAAECLSDSTLDAWLANELSAAEREGVRVHLDGCDKCRTRIETIEQETAAFLSQAPSLRAHAMVAEADDLQQALKRNRTMMVASSAFALVAMVALAVYTQRKSEETRLKGAPHIDFFVKRGEQVSQGVTGDVVHPGDQLRFTYSHRAPTHLALIGVDDRSATVYFPSQSKVSASVPGGTKQPLDFGIAIDKRLGVERVIAVFCPSEFKLLDVAKSLRGPQPEPPPGCTLDVVVLQREPKL